MRRFFLPLILLLAIVLRGWAITSVPVSLFGDELDVGYQALSILKTGRDYSGNFMPIHFQSLDESRTPLYLYANVPTVALFGVSPLGVRLPALIFGILGIWAFYLLVLELFKNHTLALLSAFFLTISPWHIQYSRAGFEVTELLFFFLLGLYAFVKGMRGQRWYLIISAVCLGLTPWVYSTAKLYLPITLVILAIVYGKSFMRLSRKTLLITALVFVFVVLPITYDTIFGHGAQRFNSIAITNDKTIEGTIGENRLNDSKTGSPAIIGKIIHNKPLLLWDTFWSNYIQAYSPEFLFFKGDPLPRHSVGEMGEFYGFELPLLVLGFIFFLQIRGHKKEKFLILLVTVTAAIPSALTQGGGSQATRLILELPTLTLFVSLGALGLYQQTPLKWKKLVGVGLFAVMLIGLLRYEHYYFYHYPQQSEKWWHAGYQEMVSQLQEQQSHYQKIIISQYDEPSLKFVVDWSQYPPEQFQQKYPLPQVEVEGFGKAGKLDNYYFTEIGQGVDLYKIGDVLPKDVLYVIPAKQSAFDLGQNPSRVPQNLNLLSTIKYPSGAAAFYFITKK